MPIRTIHNQGQPFAVPSPTQCDAPEALVLLMHRISDSITSQSRRGNPIRTVRMDEGLNTAIEHEGLNSILYSFSTDIVQIVRYTPVQWNRISVLVIQVGEELQARSDHSGGTMFVFLNNGRTIILTKSAREHGGTVRRTTSWAVAMPDFLAEIQQQMEDLGREVYGNGFTTQNEPLKNAGRQLVSRGYTAMNIARQLSQDSSANDRSDGGTPLPSVVSPTDSIHTVHVL